MLLVRPTSCSWFERDLPLFSFSFRALILRDSLIRYVYVFLHSCRSDWNLVAWVPGDGEPALLVSHCLTHPVRGWGMVAERRTETADRVARYQTD